MFVGCLAMLIIFMRLFQETPTGKVLHHYLVEVPLEKMDKIDAGHLIFLMIGLLLIPSFAAVFSADIAIVMAWDFALYYEALIATWTIASVTKLKLMGTKLRISIQHIASRLPKPRVQSVRAKGVEKRPQSKSANDNDDHGRYAIAA